LSSWSCIGAEYWIALAKMPWTNTTATCCGMLPVPQSPAPLMLASQRVQEQRLVPARDQPKRYRRSLLPVLLDRAKSCPRRQFADGVIELTFPQCSNGRETTPWVLVVQKRANGCFDASWLWSGGIFSRLSAFFGLEALLMTTPAAQGGSSPADGRRLAAN
jgi:hypothetical protein